MIKTSITVLGILFLIIACSKKSDSVATNCSTTISFAADVNPVIQSTCAINPGCHGSGSTNGPGPLLNHTQVFSARANIRIAVANGTMPQNSTLSATQKNAILCWIDSGALNN